MKRGSLIALGLLAALLVAPGVQAFELPWAAKTEDEAPAGPPRPVVTEFVSDSDFKGRSVPGVIMARNQVTLAFQTLGRLVDRPVNLGDDVAVGEVLAELDPDDLEDNVRAAAAAADTAEVQLSTARSTAERTRALAARNVASTAQLEQAEQALAAAQAAAEQARSELIRARDAEGFAQMTAPFAGVISAVHANPGVVLNAGDPVLQLSAQDTREAVIDLPEAALSQMGDDAVFTVWQDDGIDKEIRATVERIEPLADSATRTRRVHLALQPGHELRLGALIRARLAGETQIAMTLPKAAVIRHGGKTYVWRVTRDGDNATVARVPVTLGEGLLGQVFVEAGLSQGDEVVTRGVHSLSEGQQVGRRVEP